MSGEQIADEVELLRAAYEALAGLPYDAQRRGLDWLTARLNSEWRKVDGLRATQLAQLVEIELARHAESEASDA